MSNATSTTTEATKALLVIQQFQTQPAFWWAQYKPEVVSQALSRWGRPLTMKDFFIDNTTGDLLRHIDSAQEEFDKRQYEYRKEIERQKMEKK